MLKTIQIVMVSFLVLAPWLAQATSAHGRSCEQPAAEQLDPSTSSSSAVAEGSFLAGKPWQLEELTGEPLAGEQAPPYLLFMNNGDFFGFGGCNYFVGKYRTGDAGKIIVSSLRASHQHCSEMSKVETTLLTSLVLANTMLVRDDELTFYMNGSNLLRLSHAPTLPVDELTRQGMLLKKHKARTKKARSKKKKLIAKTKGLPKPAGPRISKKRPPVATRTVQPH